MKVRKKQYKSLLMLSRKRFTRGSFDQGFFDNFESELSIFEPKL